MEQQSNGGWSSTMGPGASSSNTDLHNQIQQRSIAGYGSNSMLQHGPPMQMGGPLQPGPFYNSHSSGNSLPALVALTQASPHPLPRPQPAAQQQHSPPLMPHRQSQGLTIPHHVSAYSLPGGGQTIQNSPPHNTVSDRRGDYRGIEMHEMGDLQRQHDTINHLEQDREREPQTQRSMDHQRSPPGNHAASIPLQQPIASRIPSTLHGPNGILSSNPNVGIAQSGTPLSAPNGPVNAFANGASHEGVGRPFGLQPGQNTPQNPLVGFNGPPAPLTNGGAAMSQGQQPILNDALSYLDQVKVRFQEHPDVYNKFLDIMKDFKSQAIDTPGVIDRVSTLFNGHPELIQGFNTFLPPGYRIECGTHDDPNSIRVTTPMGTTVSTMASFTNHVNGVSNGHLMDSTSSARHVYAESGYRTLEGAWDQARQADNLSGGPLSPSSRIGAQGMAIYNAQAISNLGQGDHHGVREDELPSADAAALAHQQEHQGVSQLQNAISATSESSLSHPANVYRSPNGASSATPGQNVAGLNAAGMGYPPGSQIGMEKRGPVEFNHAISYVNKIKNRFATQPEIYKQFLEILQTYQRESKPIQDVYAQVTQLFNGAPDLLEDFKQFLPESAAQAKAQAAARQATEDAAMLSNVRGDTAYIANMPSLQTQTPRPETKMPPIGNFAPPPSAGKDNKKRRGGAGAQITIGTSTPVGLDIGSSINGRSGNLQNGTASKRARVSTTKPVGADPPLRSPSLVPELPHPLPPATNTSNHSEEIAFFDRVKKFLANKSTFNEFLKLCNLFSQDLIDRNTLVHRADQFFGHNHDLMAFFRKFVLYDGRDETIENKPVQSDAKVSLSNCRALGPSYRLLPKRERLKKCSGRENDEMCKQVLNDEWASHPTWASEDSGFIAHRKNTFEEALHRIEEERHDYDFNIETCQRTIQLLDPIVQQVQVMSEEERIHYVLPPGLGGQSDAIYSRVIKKIYDRTRGAQVVADMYARPTVVCTVVLSRLKQKVEEWKASQREWEKVWREQTYKQFWKSLDHQGIYVKTENKRQFQPKALRDEIQVKYEEQKMSRVNKVASGSNFQFDYSFEDIEVIYDACHILLTYLHHTHAGTHGDQTRVENFFKTFIPILFGLDRDVFQRRMSDVYDESPPNEENEDEVPVSEESSAHRGRRTATGKKGNLLRGVLDRGQHGKQGRREKENSSALESKESTPDFMSIEDESVTPTETPSEQHSRLDITEHRWMEHPMDGNTRHRQSLKVNEPYSRVTYSLYANTNIYCFLRMFRTLYERLKHVKEHEARVHEDVQRAKALKPATELRIADKNPADFFIDIGPTANYYQQIVKMCEDISRGEDDMMHLEDTLRRFYMVHGWQLYNFDKMLAAIIRFAQSILVNDAKDKSGDIITLFYKNRKEVETTHQSEIDYRKQVEKLVKDGDIYRLVFNQSSQHLGFQIFRKDDKTFNTDEMTLEARWSYYISSYVMRDWTEGVTHAIRWPFLRRNMPRDLVTEEQYGQTYLPQWNEDGLIVRICANNYHLLYDAGTSDWWVHDAKVRRKGLSGEDQIRKERRRQFEDKFVEHANWISGLSAAEIEEANSRFRFLAGEPILEDEGQAANGNVPRAEESVPGA